MGEGASRVAAPSGLSPVKTFLVLMLLVAGVTAASLVRPDAEPLRAPASLAAAPRERAEGESRGASAAAPAESRPAGALEVLSDARAVAVFGALRTRLDRAITRRDPSLGARVFAGDSEVEARTARVIDRLRRDGVVDMTRVKSLKVVVLTKDAAEIKLREVALLRPCFRTDRGKDVTKAPAAVLQVGVWRLARGPEGWRIVDGGLLRDRIVESKNAKCP